MSSIGGLPLASLSLSYPASGAWWASALLAGASSLPDIGPTTIVVGDLTLAGSVVLVGEEGVSNVRAIVRGAPGLWLPLPRGESWQANGGVRLKTVLAALAKTTGETLVQPADVSVGTSYSWPAAGRYVDSTGAMVLRRLVALGAVPTWRVEPGGTVRFDAWPASGAADAKGRLDRRRIAIGARYVALDSAATAFLPGATLEGLPIGRVVFAETAAELRAEVWQR